ncbi:MAG: hypothetical protein KGI56_00730 [Acidobacteriota bacterium]|nr:hypothetical protein [Acidobacteriota bacterium]
MHRPALRLLVPVAVAVAGLGLASSCRPHPRVPAWVQSAPEDSMLSFSGGAGWMLTQPDIQNLLAREPEASRALDLFLQKARINPHTETGRLTLHLLKGPTQGKGLGQILIQLDQFQDPKALLAALAGDFPEEGMLHLNGRDWPLYVILDLDTPAATAHIRAASDEQGQLWIGDLSALQRLASQKTLAARPDAAAAAAWINAKAPFQGYLQPEALLGGLQKNLPETSTLRDLPRGLDALFWSVAPGASPGQPSQFDLAIGGSAEGIAQIAPWLQRLVALVSAVQPAPGAAPPELMQEKRRVGLRATLTDAQLKLVMEKLGQPMLSFKSVPPA